MVPVENATRTSPYWRDIESLRHPTSRQGLARSEEITAVSYSLSIGSEWTISRALKHPSYSDPEDLFFLLFPMSGGNIAPKS